jgi:hypothetical protein
MSAARPPEGARLPDAHGGNAAAQAARVGAV